MITEADTCRKYILPKLRESEWDDEQISEQKTITDGQIVIIGDTIRRRRQKRVDYLLRYGNGIMMAVVEAKAAYKRPADGIQQAMEYAIMLDLKFAYSTNGKGIVEHDFLTGKESTSDRFPSPDELWTRLVRAKVFKNTETEKKILSSTFYVKDKTLRYYQEIAISRTIEAILSSKKRILLTMATGTGKTTVAFQIIWKLWSSMWNSSNEHRRPKVLYLADRNVLVDDPKDKDFAPFEEARWKIQGDVNMSRDIYFSTYQAIAKDERRPGLYKQYSPGFFDLIVVDECHRGSARDESNWREILEYFNPAYQVGMTATPLRKDNRDTYKYFGNPVYTYSLKQGIEDGFLAPYKVYRIVTDVDAAGWRPAKGEKDQLGRIIPDMEYLTPDFEKVISMQARTTAIAKHITDFLKKNDRMAKTIIFCVDMEHAEQMRMALNNENSDIVRKYPDYVVRIVSEEGSVGRAHLSRFQDVESETPVIVTTSQLLTTGIDIPTCKNVVLVKVIGSMTDFKQIIGRGTRVRDDHNKFFFNILDYTGSATRLFADPQFDGEPALLTEEQINALGERISTPKTISTPPFRDEPPEAGKPEVLGDDDEGESKKLYVDGGIVKIASEVVYELDAQGKRMRVVKYTDYTREKVLSMFTKAADLRSKWTDPEERRVIIAALEERGVTLDKLMEVTRLYDADRFDLLCHIAFSSPIRTRRERVEMLRKGRKDFFDQYAPLAREILSEILDKYIEYGSEQFKIPDILKVSPIDKHGNVAEIAAVFGGTEKLRTAINTMQSLLYEEKW